MSELIRKNSDYVEYVKLALSNVKADYLTVKRDIDGFLSQFERKDREKTKNLAVKYRERVFCYELYHQLRLIQCREPSFPNELKIHAEIKKEVFLTEIYRNWKITKLEKEYIPDFIFHNPKNADKQKLVIEVKINPDNKKKEYIYDLKKIHEFIDKYKFEEGCLIALNKPKVELFEIMKEIMIEFGNIFEKYGKNIFIIYGDVFEYKVVRLSEF